jgi:hypothetical protein
MRKKMNKKMRKESAFKTSKTYTDYYEEFDRQLQPLEIKLKDVEGDGNCLFRVFGDQLDGDESTHMVFRESACKYILEHK